MEPTRHFISVDGRRVHLWRMGEGPPALLIHSSPANARLLRPEMDRLADRFTLFAFDTPGFGLSEPLPGADLTIADLADATAAAMTAIGLPPCPVFGTHTGAAIALELGVRHPAQVTGLVLDGLPMFTPEEITRNFGDYFRPLAVTDLGGVYSEAWTRFRDQSIWFPWSDRRAANLNDYDLSSAASTHRWVSMYFEAAAHYVPAYRAALGYGPRAATAVAELERPCLITATDTDMLYPHLDRLPPLRNGQEVRRIGRSHDAKFALIGEGFERFGAPSAAPAVADRLPLSSGVARSFVAAGATRLHLRSSGDPDAARRFLLLHDAPGSSAWIEPQIASLGRRGFAMAPDLPGHGESASAGPADLDSYAALLSALLAAQRGSPVTVVGFGFGSVLAARLARRAPALVDRLLLCGGPLPTGEERAELAARLTPPIAIAADGGHWYRTWLMLRDAAIWWPWYRSERAAQRRVDMVLTAAELHARVLDVMGQRETYGDLARAALSADMAADLAACAGAVTWVIGAPLPLAAHDGRLAAHAPWVRTVEWDPELAAALAVSG